MKICLNADRITDTCTHSSQSLHNCPSCKCSHTTIYRNLSSTPQYFHKISETRMRQNNLYNSNSSIPTIVPRSSNIYVCKRNDLLPGRQKSMNQLFRSSVLDTKRRDDYLDSRSLARANITFTYISPKKEKPHRSSDCRFSTKQFKQKHFPFLQSHQRSIQTSQQSNKIKDNPYYTTYTKQSPPKKHKVLRINKSKSKNKMKTISSHLSQKQLSIKEIKPETPIQRQNQQYQVDYPIVTPINALWEKINQSPNNQHINNAEMKIKPHNPFQRPSIEHIDLQKSVCSVQVYKLKQNSRNEVQNNLIYEKLVPLNSVQSIVQPKVDLFNFAKSSNQKHFDQDIFQYQDHQKSQIQKQKSIISSQQLQIKGLEGLSQQLSQELQLNYDYYCPNYDYFIAKNDSDRSVSMSVSLY